MRGSAWKKMWWRVHWALGLCVGGVFVLIGLTGSALVFYQVIDEWLNQGRLTTASLGTYRSFDDMAAAVKTARPDVPGPYGLFLPQARHGAVVGWLKIPAGDSAEVRDLEVTIDPYSGDVLSRDRVWGYTLVSFVYELHKGLWLGRAGEVVVGGLAFLLLLSVATGVYLWWPRPGKVRQALAVRPDGSLIRKHYDIHKLSGLAGAPVLVVLAGTGVYLEFPEYVIPAIHWVSPVTQETARRSTVSTDAPPISIDRAVALAKEALPTGELKWIGIPQQPSDAFQIGLRQPDEPRHTSGESIVWVDQYGGVLHVREWETLTTGDKLVAWLFPLHNGEAFGLPGRWIVFVSGFVPIILYGTALRMWWLKRLAHRRQQACR